MKNDNCCCSYFFLYSISSCSHLILSRIPFHAAWFKRILIIVITYYGSIHNIYRNYYIHRLKSIFLNFSWSYFCLYNILSCSHLIFSRTTFHEERFRLHERSFLCLINNFKCLPFNINVIWLLIMKFFSFSVAFNPIQSINMKVEVSVEILIFSHLLNFSFQIIPFLVSVKHILLLSIVISISYFLYFYYWIFSKER